jgi:hypothetical protein
MRSCICIADVRFSGIARYLFNDKDGRKPVLPRSRERRSSAFCEGLTIANL